MTIFFSILIFTLIFTIYSISNQKSEILKSLNNEAESIINTIMYVSSDAIVLDDSSSLIEYNYDFIKKHDLLKAIILLNKDKKYYIITESGWLFTDNIDKKYLAYENEEINSVIIKSPILNKEVFHYVKKIEFHGTYWGHIHLSLSIDEYNSTLKNMYIHFISFFTILFIVILFISYIIAKKITNPIINLNIVAKNISKGNLNLRSQFKRSDEIGELSNTFNEMLTKIESSQEELEQKVKDRTLALQDANENLEKLNNSLDKKVKVEVERRTKQESLLIQQSRLASMGEMLGNIAHQWRQPLSTISTASTGIRLQKELNCLTDEDLIATLDAINNSTQYLSHTIEDFSNFFKPNKNSTEFSVKEKIEESLSLIKASLNYYHIEVKKEFLEEHRVYGFPNEYSQSVMNILSNAKDILVERKTIDPKIFIKIYEQNNYCILEIEDNAGGIDDDIMIKIFDPYFTTKHQAQGTGIGLYMSKMIIEKNMNGKLEVNNGKYGAVFKVSISIV